MSNITKTMMSLELEFIEPTAHGFINWVDSSGNSLATLGLGSTAKAVDGNGNEVSTGGVKYLEWNLIDVDFIKITGGGIQFDEQRSLSIDSIRTVYNEYNQAIGQENYISSQIHLNNSNYKDLTKFEPANIIYTEGLRFEELKKIKTSYASKTNALILEHENTIAFSNPVSKRLIGQIDTVNEAFVWYGAFSLGSIVSDSLFEIKRVDSKYNLTLNATTNKKPEIGFKYEDVLQWSINVNANNLNIKNISGQGIELRNDNSVLFTGEIVYNNMPLLNYFYTQEQLNNGILDTRYYIENEVDTIIENSINIAKLELNNRINELELRINELENSVDLRYDELFVYKNEEWVNITNTILKIDEYEDRILLTPEENDIIYSEAENRYYNNLWQQQTIETINDMKDMPWVLKINDLCIDNNTVYKWDGNNWEIDGQQSVEDYYITAIHLSSINNPINEKIYKITSTGKFYKYTNGEFISSESPIPDLAYRPSQYNTVDKIIRFYKQ